jgi:hypothetical protein
MNLKKNEITTTRRLKEIEKMFSDINDEKKVFDECPIDDMIIAPDCLIRITGIDDEILCRLFYCENNAQLFCIGVQTGLGKGSCQK